MESVADTSSCERPQNQEVSSQRHVLASEAIIDRRWLILPLIPATLALLLTQPGCSSSPDVDDKIETRKAITVLSNSKVSLNDESRDELGIEATTVKPIAWKKTRRVYGRVVPDPNASFEIQSAFSGTLTNDSVGWPKIGQVVEAGQILGHLAVRVSREVRLDLENRLADARVKLPAEEEVIRVLGRTVESLRLVTHREIISRSELDTAVVNLERSKMQHASNREIVTRLEQSLKRIDDAGGNTQSIWNWPIVAQHQGIVTELHVNPGASLEAGRAILVLVDHRSALVRIDFPNDALQSDTHNPGAVDSLDIQIAGQSYEATRIGLAPIADSVGQFVPHLYEVVSTDTAIPVRPGMQAMAELPIDHAWIQAYSIPESAIVFHEGMPFVYVQVDDAFHRKSVKRVQRSHGQWVVERNENTSIDPALGLQEGDEVVSRNAQVLLSMEFLGSGGDPD